MTYHPQRSEGPADGDVRPDGIPLGFSLYVCSMIVTCQLTISGWHERIGDAPVADAILDRLVHTTGPIT
jgi:hypothetical protein